MKTLFNLKSTLLVLLFGMTIFSVSAQREAVEERVSDCEKVEWNAKKGNPTLSSERSNCLVVTLVNFEKGDVQKMSEAAEALSSDEVRVSVSEDRSELRIDFTKESMDARTKTTEFEKCLTEIKRRL